MYTHEILIKSPCIFEECVFLLKAVTIFTYNIYLNISEKRFSLLFNYPKNLLQVSAFIMQITSLSKLLILLLSLALANAVTIQNWSRTHCGGNSLQCTNVAEHRCCVARNRLYSSSRFIGIDESDIGVVCTRRDNKNCGTIKGAANGPRPCVSRPSMLGLKGSLWFSCLSCLKRDAGNSSVPISSQFVNQSSSAVDEVLADKVIIDNHMFEFNHPNQSQEIVDALDALVDSENIVYDSIDASLRQWEVAMSPDDV